MTVILVTLVASVLGARAALRGRAPATSSAASWASVLALWQGGLTLYGGIVGGHGRRAAGGARAGAADVDRGRRADAVARARHDVRARRLLPERLLLRAAHARCRGASSSRPTPSPGLEFGDRAGASRRSSTSRAAGLALFALVWAAAPAACACRACCSGASSRVLALVRIPLDLTRAYEAERGGPATLGAVRDHREPAHEPRARAASRLLMIAAAAARGAARRRRPRASPP